MSYGNGISRGQGAGGTAFTRMQSRKLTREVNNTLTVVEVWQCRTQDFLTAIPADGTAHTTYATTYLQGPVAGEDKGGNVTTYTLIYKGFDATAGGSNPADSPPHYFWEGSDATTPIPYLDRGTGRTFQDLVDSAEAGGFNAFDDQGHFIGFPLGAQSSGAFDIAGLTSFFDVTGVWNCERFASSPPDVFDGCKIDGSVPGSPPSLPDAEWLYMTPSYDKLAANLYFIRERWIPSGGQAGWCNQIYATR